MRECRVVAVAGEAGVPDRRDRPDLHLDRRTAARVDLGDRGGEEPRGKRQGLAVVDVARAAVPEVARIEDLGEVVRRRAEASAETDIDITARVEQLDVNTQINPRAWTVDVPSDADPMTLDELRSIAPLADRTKPN